MSQSKTSQEKSQLKASQEKIENYRKLVINDIKKELEDSLSSIGKIKSKINEDANFKIGFLGEPEPSQPLNLYYKIRFFHVKKWYSKPILLGVYIDINVKEDRIAEVRVSIYNKDAFKPVNEKITKLKQKYRKYLESCNFNIIKEFQ